MNKDRLEKAFGQTPASFEMAMRKAIAEHNYPKKRRFGTRELLLVAVLTALLCGVAYGAVFGLDLLGLIRKQQPVLPEAETLVRTDIEQSGGELPDVTFSLDEVLSDGRQIFFTLRATPKNPDEVMLVDADRGITTSIDVSVDHWKDIPEEEKRALTFFEAGQQSGKTLICPYLSHVRVGENLLSFSPVTLAYDEGAILYVYAADYPGASGEEVTLALSVEQIDPLIGYDTRQEAQLTSKVELTAAVQNYLWGAPYDLPEIGATITELYASATPTGTTVYVRYRPIDGADDITKRDVDEIILQIIDDEGAPVQTISSSDGWVSTVTREVGGGYLFTSIMPAEYPFTGVNIQIGDAQLHFDPKDAVSDLEGSAMPNEDDGIVYGNDIIASTGNYDHPSAEIKLGGAEIPLLRDFDTDYSGIMGEMEALAGDANLRVTADGYTLSIDQIAACDGYIWLSYTLTGDAPLEIFEDSPDIQGDYALNLSAPYLWGAVDGNHDVDLLLTDYAQQAFLADDHTLRGWKLLEYAFEPQTFPERYKLSIWTHAFLKRRYDSERGGIDNTPFGFEFTIDRGGARQNVQSVQPNAKITLGDRDIEVLSVSTSPLGGLIILNETMPGDHGPNEFTLTDEHGNVLTSEQHGGIPVSPGGTHSRTTMTHSISFVGGYEAKQINMIPLASDPETFNHHFDLTHVPIDQPLPYTAEFKNGMYVTIDSIDMDLSGMEIRYRSNQLYPFLYLLDGKGEYEGEAVESEVTPDRIDRATGQRIQPYLWRIERGAAEGERIKKETLENIRYIGLGVPGVYPLQDQAIKIPME